MPRSIHGQALGKMLFLVLIGATTHAEGQSKKYELLAKVKERCASSADQLSEKQIPRFSRKQIAFKVLVDDWQQKMPLHHRDKMPIELQKGLALELKALETLVNLGNASQGLFGACAELSPTMDGATVAKVIDAASRVDAGYVKLQSSLKDQAHVRREFKASLANLTAHTTFSTPLIGSFRLAPVHSIPASSCCSQPSM